MAGSYNGVTVPSDGKKIGYANGKYDVPDNPIVPFIEGDGTGRDIWKASLRVFDAAVEKAYRGKRRVAWYEVFAGEKAKAKFDKWLPDDTVEAIREFRVAIKGPLTTPVGGGIRSLNVALRQILDLYCCVRPVKYYQGVAVAGKTSRAHGCRHLPRKHGRRLRWHRVGAGNADCDSCIEFLNKDMLEGRQETDSPRLRRRHQANFSDRNEAPGPHGHSLRARNGRKSVTLVHKGNIQKFTEGAFRKWGYELAIEEFRDQVVTERESWILDNKDKNPNLTIAQNAELVEPGLEFAQPDTFGSQSNRSERSPRPDLRRPTAKASGRRRS